MKNIKSSANLNANNSLNIKQLLSPSNRKVQGFDKTTISNGFSSKIDKIKNKPKVEALQDQYIKGLQDEIKYLEMELKLLQEKDIQKHGQIDQLQKFFGDGIPINENILAIKNGYNNYKTSNEKKIKELSGEKQERTAIIDGLSHKIEKMLAELNENQKGNRQFSEQSNQAWFGLIGKEASIKKYIEKEQDGLKVLKADNRKVFQKIEKLTRTKLIDNITLIKYDNCKNNKLNSLKESIIDKQNELLVLQNQHSVLLKDQDQKGYIIKLQEENLGQRKKIIILERDNDNIKNKIKEKAMELQQKLKERMNQLQSKINMKNKVQDLKQAISKANSLTVQFVIQHSKEKQIEHLKNIIAHNKKIAKYTDHYANILSDVENSIENLAQRKPQIKSQIQAQMLDLVRLKKRIQEEKQRQIKMHAELIQIEQKFNYNKDLITPLQEKTKKNNDQIQAYLGQRHRLLQEIKIKQKQLELIFILKGFNFQEVQISKVSSKNIQQQMLNFLKNWDKIQRNV